MKFKSLLGILASCFVINSASGIKQFPLRADEYMFNAWPYREYSGEKYGELNTHFKNLIDFAVRDYQDEESNLILVDIYRSIDNDKNGIIDIGEYISWESKEGVGNKEFRFNCLREIINCFELSEKIIIMKKALNEANK